MYQLWPGQAQYMIILPFIWLLWSWPSTYLKKYFKWHFSFSRTTTVQIISKSMHKCTSYGPDKPNICSFWSSFDPCDLDLQPTLKNVSNGTSPSRGQQMWKIILKSMHKCTSYGQDKLNLWSFRPSFDPSDLDFQPTWKNVSNGTSPSRGQQLCKTILKSVHKCTSYGSDNLNIWPFWPLFDPCDFDLQRT